MRKKSHVNAITIDVEDYYQLFAREHLGKSLSMGDEVLRSTAVMTDMMARRNVRGTFFILGNVAKAHPQLAPRLAAAGHEIGVHGFNHHQVFRLTARQFAAEVGDAKKLLEDQIGRPVVGHRAPVFSIGLETPWALSVLAGEGFLYDSSIFPFGGRRYGWPGFPLDIRRVELPDGRSIIEAPLSIVRFMGRAVPACGGGYLRHFPLWYTRWSMQHICQNRPTIVYLHPYETDTTEGPAEFRQMLADGPLRARLRHAGQCNNRGTVAPKLEMLLDSFRFAPLAEVIQQTFAADAGKPPTTDSIRFRRAAAKRVFRPKLPLVTETPKPPSAPPAHPSLAVVTTVGLTIRCFFTRQMSALAQRGYHVCGVCADDEDSREVAKSGLTIHNVGFTRGMDSWQDLKALWQLYRLLRSHRFQIIHTHTPKAAFLGQLAAWLARVPVRVNTVHGLFFVSQTNPITRWMFKAMEVLACSLAHRVFCVSEEDIEYFWRHTYLPPEKLSWMVVGIDLKRFSPQTSPENRLAIREELNIPQDAFVFGIVARMVKEKGFVELFEAFAEVRKTCPNAWLLHVGPIDDSRLDGVNMDVVRRLGIESHCRFAGMRSDVPRLLSAMDTFVLPSHREGYPVSVMEACASQLPVIVTDIRGCREAVAGGQTGLIVPVRDPVALAAAMKQLHDDPELRETLSRAARQRAEQYFDENRILEELVRSYNDLLSRNVSNAP